jgi:hypothetical protein
VRKRVREGLVLGLFGGFWEFDAVIMNNWQIFYEIDNLGYFVFCILEESFPIITTKLIALSTIFTSITKNIFLILNI